MQKFQRISIAIATVLTGMILGSYHSQAPWLAVTPQIALASQQACSDVYEPNDTPQAATSIGLAQNQRHSFCTSGDQDWISFRATASAFYRIETSNLTEGTDTFLELFQSDGSTMLAFDDDSGQGRGSVIVAQLQQSALYYVKINQFGDLGNPGYMYDIQITTVDCVDIYEPDGTPSQASDIEMGTNQVHSFCGPGDEDWVAFTAVAGAFYDIQTSNLSENTDTIMELYASDGSTLIASDDDGGPGFGSRIVTRLPEAGVYYVRVRQFNDTGDPNYTYNLQVGPVGCEDSYEPNNVPSQARPATIGEAQAHLFCVNNDEDWISFPADKRGTYRIETSNLTESTDTFLELYAGDGATLIASDDDSAGNLASRIVTTIATPGIYYVRVRNLDNSGSPNYGYNLLISTPTCDDPYEPNNNPFEATPFPVNDSLTQIFCIAGDEDWVSFEGPADRGYIIETSDLSPVVDTVLEVYASDGSTLIASDDDGGEGLASRVEISLPVTGTYYVKVQHFAGSGDPNYSYTLNITTVQELGGFE